MSDHQHSHRDGTSSDTARADGAPPAGPPGAQVSQPVDHGHQHAAAEAEPGQQSEHGHEHGAEDAGHQHSTGLRGLIDGWINPHSHDSADRVDQALEGSAEGIWALKLSLVVLLVTACLQVVVVLISGSVALLADTIHNFADALTSVPLWIAFVLGRRAASRRYTYGYGRAEDLAGVLIVLVILASAFLAAWEAFQKLLNPQPITSLGLVAVAAVIGFLGNEAAAIYRIRVGKKIGSAALVADGYHARTDGLTSLAVLIGVVGTAAGFPIADPLVGVGISIAILLVTRDAATSIWHRVMDAVDPELIDTIERTSRAVEGVEGVNSVRARWQGHRISAELNILVDEDLPTWRSHEIVENVRRDLFHTVPRLSEIIVHADPFGQDSRDHHGTTAHHEQASLQQQ